jgi:hypothetical protein
MLTLDPPFQVRRLSVERLPRLPLQLPGLNRVILGSILRI